MPLKRVARRLHLGGMHEKGTCLSLSARPSPSQSHLLMLASIVPWFAIASKSFHVHFAVLLALDPVERVY